MRRNAAGLFPGLLAGLLLLSVPAGRADAQRTLRTIGKDLGTGVRDILYVWSAPARADGRDWLGAGLATALVVATGAADRDIQKWVVRHPSSAVVDAFRPFREGQDIPLVDAGSPKRILPFTAALYGVGFIADSPTIRDAAMGCASAEQAQAIIHLVALNVVQRERPLTAGGDPFDVGWGSGPWERHSFFSGHASNIMACVAYWNERFDIGPVEPVLYAVALGIGLGRIPDQRHWASDVVSGTIIGHAAGRTVGRRARKRAERGGEAPASTGMIHRPYLVGGAHGVAAGWQIAF
jgi:membrane-associated phospholipid phosphatase